jgi:hypothetical protein
MVHMNLCILEQLQLCLIFSCPVFLRSVRVRVQLVWLQHRQHSVIVCSAEAVCKCLRRLFVAPYMLRVLAGVLPHAPAVCISRLCGRANHAACILAQWLSVML